MKNPGKKSWSAKFEWDELGFSLLITLCALPHILLHRDGGVKEIILIALVVLLVPVVALWRRHPYVVVAVVGAVLVVWTALMFVGRTDILDFVPFLCTVPLIVYGPARYGESFVWSCCALVAAMAWALVVPVLVCRAVEDFGSNDRVAFLVALVLLQWIFYVAVAMMGRSQRQEVAVRDAELQALNRQDRLTMAREIHDALSRSITVINVQATAGAATKDLTALDRIRDLSGSALAEVRGLITSLRASGDIVEEATQDKAALAAAMGKMIGGFRDVGLRIDTVFPSGDDRDFLVDKESALVQFTNYRIFGECLTNVVRHQGPDSRVVVTAMPDFPVNTLHVRVESWAGTQGRLPQYGAGSGVGLTGMRDRVESIGGTLTWSGSVGHNGHFVVEALLPIVLSGDGGPTDVKWWNIRRRRRGIPGATRGDNCVR